MSYALCTTRQAVLTLPLQDWPLTLYSRAILDDKQNPNPEIKQILPYVMLTNEAGEILSYRRVKTTTEGRLAGNRSIGFGGHVETAPSAGEDLLTFLKNDALRELAEELHGDEHTGLTADDLLTASIPETSAINMETHPNKVNHVHVGIPVSVVFRDGLFPKGFITKPDEVEDLQWIKPGELSLAEFEKYEPWSKRLLFRHVVEAFMNAIDK